MKPPTDPSRLSSHPPSKLKRTIPIELRGRFCLWLLLLGLAACTSPAPQLSTTPTTEPVPPPRQATATRIAYPTPTLAPTSTLAPTASPTPYLTPTVYPLPTIAPYELSHLLDKLPASIRLEHEGALVRIAGWPNGWWDDDLHNCTGLTWIDDERLLLLPVTGEYEWFRMHQQSLPVVIHLESGKTWLPVKDGSLDRCRRAYWSDRYQKLVAFGESETVLYDRDGGVIRHFRGGGPTGDISPSGRRILTGSLLIDLETDQAKTGIKIPGSHFGNIAWSPDESKVFRCCFGYTDFSTEKSKSFTLDIVPMGRGCGPDGCIGSQWIDDRRVMVFWPFTTETGEFSQTNPIIDPVTQTYLNGRPTNYPGDCQEVGYNQYYSPNYQYSAVICSQRLYWMDFLSQTAFATPEEPKAKFAGWAPDSQFLLLSSPQANRESPGYYYLQPAQAGDLISLYGAPIFLPEWKDEMLYFLTGAGDVLVSYTLSTGERQEMPLNQQVTPRSFWTEQGAAPPSIVLPGADGQSFALVNLSTAAVKVVKLDQPVNMTVLGKHNAIWQEQNTLSWISADGLRLISLDMLTGAVSQSNFLSPLYQVFHQPDGPGLIVQALDGGLWWVPAVGMDARLLASSAPDARQLRWSPSGQQAAFISGTEILIVMLAP